MKIEVELRTRRTGRGISIGLDPNNDLSLGTEGDIVLNGKGVAARHARIFMADSGVVIAPIDQAPLAVNGKPVQSATRVNDGDWLALGSAFYQINIAGGAAPHPPSAGEMPAASATQARVSIGRLPECDFSIPSPLVSRVHAYLRMDGGQFILEDQNSTNGTFLNGERIVGSAVLKRGDKVEIATFAFLFTGDALEAIDEAGLVRLEARGVTKEVLDHTTKKPRRLLDGIDLVVEPGEFVAIFGTSGSGKSTLLDTLNGRRPANIGKVLYNGTDFYASLDLFRAAIGYVPQQDIVHRKIRVKDALHYTARLRLPSDTSDEEISSHIDRVLAQVGLDDKAMSPIDTPSPLSGGQLKRVSLAVELIANPNILFLDEVTSGLDAGTDKKMMQLFSELAAGNKTVVCVTHTLENIDVCHLVLLLHRGRIVYYGPPGDALRYFDVGRLSDVYEKIESMPAEYWADKFLNSEYYRKYIGGRIASSETPVRDAAVLEGSAGNKGLRARFSQLATLIRRYLDLLLSDRKNLAILLLQAPLIGLLIGLVFDVSGHGPARVAGETQIGFMLVLSAIWCGCLNSTREVVKELPIYLRERAVNLGIIPYLLSKLLPLAVLCFLQCLALLGIVSVLTSWFINFAARLGILFLAGMAATAMGLAISTFVDSNDKAVAVVPILLIPQVILSNFIVHLGKIGEAIARFSVVSFASFDAIKAVLSEEVTRAAPAQYTLTVNVMTTIAITAVFLLAALLGLKLKDYRN